MRIAKEKLQQIIKEELESINEEETPNDFDPAAAFRYLTNTSLSPGFGTALLEINKKLNEPASEEAAALRKGFLDAFEAAGTPADQVVVAAMKRIWGERET